MFGLGIPEILLIGVIALLVFGPEKIPELAQRFGKLSGQLKRTSDDVRREFYNSVYTPAEEVKRELNQMNRTLSTTKENADPAKSLPSSESVSSEKDSSSVSAMPGENPPAKTESPPLPPLTHDEREDKKT